MLRWILIGAGVVVLALWFLWWWSLGFPAQIQVCEGAAKECPDYNFFLGSIWKVVAVLDRYGVLITAVATALLAYITYQLVVGGEKTTRQVNRAYVACGGDFNKTTRVFRLDVQNNGQTPAFMTAFDVQTALAGQVGSQSALPVNRNHARWEDAIPPHDPRGKTIETRVLVPQNVAFVFGCVWYRDVWGDPHHSRFILSVRHDPTTGEDRAFPDVSGMHPDYDERT